MLYDAVVRACQMPFRFGLPSGVRGMALAAVAPWAGAAALGGAAPPLRPCPLAGVAGAAPRPAVPGVCARTASEQASAVASAEADKSRIVFGVLSISLRL